MAAATTSMNASQRRLIYGANVALTIVLAAVATGFVVWTAGRFGGRVDLTSSGMNSLSPRTVQLLKGLDQNVTITGLYTTALKEVRKYAEKHKNRVADLLDLYETAGKGHVTATMLDPQARPADVAALLKRLADKPAYKDEAKPHQEALEGFPALEEKINAFVTGELAQLEALAKSSDRLNRTRELAIITRNLQEIARDAKGTQDEIKALREADVPRYGAAVEEMRKHLTLVRQALDVAKGWFTGDALSLPDLPPEAKAQFQAAGARYAPLIAEIDAVLNKTNDLKQVKLEQAYESLKRVDAILVETDEEAVVLGSDDVWTMRDQRLPASPDGDPQEFAGEQAVSSAILKLTQKDKTAVVFVRFGGEPLLKPNFENFNPMSQQLPRAPYGHINELLGKENFLTEEWDVAASPTPPSVEGAARTVYVVFAPKAPPPANPMMQQRPPPGISPEQKQQILDAVKQSGMAVFLAGWAPPTGNRFSPMGGGTYEFDDYLRGTWGIDVKPTHLVIQFMRNTQKDTPLWVVGRSATVIGNEALRFTDQAIGKPLQSLPAGLPMAAPIELITAASRPAGVSIEPIVEVEKSEDVWASADINRVQEDLQKNDGTHLYEGDLAPPFPLAVAASNDKQKIVVFGSENFFSDEVLQMAGLVQIGNAITLAAAYPANADLFINALHWLTGDASRIAVGVSRGDVPRLDKLKDDSTLKFCQTFLVGIWPAMALLAGGLVWLARRR